MKRTGMLLATIAFVSMLGAFGSSGAADCGDNGSPTNSSGSCDTANNQVQCGEGTDTGLGILVVGSSNAELCNSGSALPVQGRVGAEQECECAYVDGDASNPHDDAPLDGWLRIDGDGVHCAERSKPNNQSYNSAPGSDLAGCAD